MILDAAVGYIIEKVDMVLVGAEGVVESGGIINQVIVRFQFFARLNHQQMGTYQIAVVAKAANKPFYVVAERFLSSSLYVNLFRIVTNSFDYIH